MWNIDCGILTEEQKQRGWSLGEDEDFLYLLCHGEVVATFNVLVVNPLELHHEIACREEIINK